jgi:hypothetical protein
MGRRWGKSVLGACITLALAASGGRAAWIAPTYKNTRPLWRTVENSLAELKKAGAVRLLRNERVAEFANGGFLALYSDDSIDGMRGEDFHLAVIDEAAKCRGESWSDVIQPTLADHDGDAILISTPYGFNWFADEWYRGVQGDGEEYKSWVAPSSDNPNPRIQRAAARAKERVSERTYQQEWLAQFVKDGAVFRNIDECTGLGCWQGKVWAYADLAIGRGRKVVGVDWAKQNDWSVFTAYDIDNQAALEQEADQKVDYNVQIDRLAQFVKRHNALAVLAESTGIGDVLCDMAAAAGIDVIRFDTTNASKCRIVGQLIADFDHRRIWIPDCQVLKGELRAFESKKTPTGMSTYSAPSGLHDDRVMSLAIAREAEVYAARDYGILVV